MRDEAIAIVSDDSTQHPAGTTVQSASQQPQVSSVSSAWSLEQAASAVQSAQQAAGTGAAVLQESTSSPLLVINPQAEPQADPQAGPRAQQNLPDISQQAANQHLQQHHDDLRELQQAHNEKQQQHGLTSDVPHSATDATLDRPGANAWHSWHRRQAGVLAAGTQPVAVCTSAVTGAGLKELLLQVERKVCCNIIDAMQSCTLDSNVVSLLPKVAHTQGHVHSACWVAYN